MSFSSRRPSAGVSESLHCGHSTDLDHHGHDLSSPQLQAAAGHWSVHVLSLPDLELFERLSLIRHCGFRSVGLYRPQLGGYELEAVREELDELSLAVSTVSFAGGFTGTIGLSYEESLADTESAIEQAVAVDAAAVVAVTGGMGGHIRKHARRLIVEGLQRAGDYAAERGRLVIVDPLLDQPEPQPRWTVLGTVEQLLDVVAEVSHPAVLASLDLRAAQSIADRPEARSLVGRLLLSDETFRPIVRAGEAPDSLELAGPRLPDWMTAQPDALLIEVQLRHGRRGGFEHLDRLTQLARQLCLSHPFTEGGLL